MSESVGFIKQGMSVMDAVNASKGVTVNTRNTYQLQTAFNVIVERNALKHLQGLVAVHLVS